MNEQQLQGQPILIYDIETNVLGSRVDPKTDRLRIFGAYSYLTDKYYTLLNTSEADIRLLIDKHKYFVGWNNIQYDNVVLSNNGYKDVIRTNRYGDATFLRKFNIDMFQIFKARAGAMKIKKGMLGDLLMSYSLDYVSQMIGVVNESDGKIKEFDYNVLKKDSWTPEELRMIEEYTIRDLEVTKKVYEWLEHYFRGFKHYLLDSDNYGKKYLTSSISVFTYKAICKALNLEEEYQNDVAHEGYGGGYVAYPAGEEFEGNLYCFDFSSLYPHVFAQCNLYSPVVGEGWTGNGVFKVAGNYNKDHMGKIEKLLMQFYQDRLKFKAEKDPREYSIKIIINTAYGLSGNPAFKHLFNPTTAADCTRLARQWTMLARKIFRDEGYEVIYTDTDSVYFRDNFDDKEKMLAVKDKILKIIFDNVPFPQKTFDMTIDDEITHMFFFKGKNKKDDSEFMDDDDIINRHLGLMKKNYIYIAKILDKQGNDTGKRKVVYKNLGVKKKSTSAITRYLFREVLIPKILAEKKVKWDKKFFEIEINKLLNNDLKIAATRYKVNSAESYKKVNQIQTQIARRYGPGIHFLIKNKKIGVGLGSKYCSIKEFVEAKLTINDIDLSGVWSELNYFIKPEKVFNLEDFGL